MPIDIAVNGRFEGRRITGVDRYASEILRCLGKRVRVIRPRGALAGVRGHLWEQSILPFLISSHEVLWSPANSGPVAVTNQVVTIHDLSVLEHAEWFTHSFRLWYSFLFPTLAQRARRVLTVSEHSRQAIIRAFKLSDDQVIAIPNGVNLQQFHPCDSASVRGKYRLRNPYVLFVGSLDPRKNLNRLLEAWDQVADFSETELVIAGSKMSIFRTVSIPTSSSRVRYLGYVPDHDLPALYSGALFFVMPSLSEGFGLTVLEAMACGTAVLAAKAGALPEVADQAAILINPVSISEMAEAMRRLLSEEGLRYDLRQRGLERAKQFSWERSSERIWEAICDHA